MTMKTDVMTTVYSGARSPQDYQATVLHIAMPCCCC